MLVNEVKPIGKVGKNLLKSKNADEIIEVIIEKPLQKACKLCKNKKIETSMSSANKKNIVRENEKVVNKKDIIEMNKKGKYPTFIQAGKGYAWIMLNFNTISDENKKILFSLEESFGEDSIWFVKSCYVETMNKLRKVLKIKPIVESFDDAFAEEFRKRQLILMYNNKYPRRSVFIRMPINQTTTIEQVEEYFEKIINKLDTNVKSL